ncbi:hypothetical protein [Neptunicella sp. SCSIO 80796]|uniref:hypothetical protein n=1 Tax=Neptunicella plasticusilytica TaxID=3117012 RepID=UPI003A4DE433
MRRPMFSCRLALYSLTVFSLMFSGMTYSAEPLSLQHRFKLEEVQWIKQKGSATLSGKAFIRLEDGSYKGCAGFNIELLPVTPYSSERIFKTYGSNQQGQILLSQNPPSFTPDAKAYHEMEIISQCDQNGEFHFNNIKAGEFYVMAFIIWEEQQHGKNLKKGGGVMHYIRLQDHQPQHILMKY